MYRREEESYNEDIRTRKSYFTEGQDVKVSGSDELPDGSFDVKDLLAIQRIIDVWRRRRALATHSREEKHSEDLVNSNICPQAEYNDVESNKICCVLPPLCRPG